MIIEDKFTEEFLEYWMMTLIYCKDKEEKKLSRVTLDQCFASKG